MAAAGLLRRAGGCGGGELIAAGPVFSYPARRLRLIPAAEVIA